MKIQSLLFKKNITFYNRYIIGKAIKISVNASQTWPHFDLVFQFKIEAEKFKISCLIGLCKSMLWLIETSSWNQQFFSEPPQLIRDSHYMVLPQTFQYRISTMQSFKFYLTFNIFLNVQVLWVYSVLDTCTCVPWCMGKTK